MVPPSAPRGLAALILSLFVCGCTVGPSYAPPTPPTPPAARFVAKAPSGAAFADPADPPSAWWRLYATPALDALVEEALTRNASLKEAEANLAYARAALTLARSQRLPSTVLSAGGQYGVTSTALLENDILGGRSAPSASGFYTLGFDASYEVDLFGRIHRAVQAAAADAESAKAAEDVARVSVAGETVRSYLDACAYAEARNAAEEGLKITQDTLEVTLKEAQFGAASDFDLARARQAVEQARAAAPAYEGQRRAALFALAVLTGRPPEEISAAADACTSPPRLERPLPSGDVQGLFKRRPDVREAERKLAASVARIGVATAALYPTVTIAPSAATAAVRPSGLTDLRNVSYGLGPMLTWSFPNTLPARAMVGEARAQASAATAAFDGAVLQALQDVEGALTAYAAELDRNRALMAARDQSQTALRLAQAQFQAGSASFLDVLSAQSVYVQSLQTLAASDEAVASDQVTAFKALGGGWEQAPSVTAPPIIDRRTGKAEPVR